MAEFDAAPNSKVPIIPAALIDESVLRGIEEELELYERVCCMFFITENYDSGYESLTNALNCKRCDMWQFIRDNKVSEWEEKLMEVLCLMQNNRVLVKLGVNPEDASTIFSTTVRESCYKINKYAKAFYGLFEMLTQEDAGKLLEHVYRDLPRPDCKTWPAEVSLELHLLWWIKIGFITVCEGGWNITKLLSILKELGMYENGVYQTLKNYDVRNKYDYDNAIININDVRDTGINNVVADNNETEDRYKISNGLVVIFNQMNFTGPINYDYRYGSEKDCSKIIDTFQNIIGFETKVHNDLGRESIYSTLDDYRRLGNQYDCVIVFLLSHGTQGNIIASDGLECPIDTIKCKLCCQVWKDKPKILVVQACQTQVLTIDGPRSEEKDLSMFEDLMVLNSTIPGECSIRHRENGTWFIQILCEVLVEKTEKPIDECLREVCKRLKKMVGNIEGKNMKQVAWISGNLTDLFILPRKVK